MGKVWKTGGVEDKLIERLFNEGKISRSITAPVLKRRFAKIFKGYSEDLIRKRIIILKKILAINYGRDTSNSSSHSRSQSQPQPPVVHENMPTLCGTYKDPNTKMDMVVAAVAVPGGVEDVKFEVSDCGTTAAVTYNWPKTMYTMDDLFKHIPLSHPKVLAARNSLEMCRQQSDDVPKSKVQIKLPIKVRGATEGKISGISRNDGTKIVMAELVGFDNN